MAATFNAPVLETTPSSRVDLTRPAIAGAGGASPSTGGAAEAVMATHEAAVDPHPQYLTPAEGDAAYVPRLNALEQEPMSGLCPYCEQLAARVAELERSIYLPGVP